MNKREMSIREFAFLQGGVRESKNKYKKNVFYIILLMAYLVTLSLPFPVAANPEGGQVSAGSATITSPAANTVQINQSSDKAVIDWQTFNVAPQERTQFQQPSSSSITYNRVNPQYGSSGIFGTVTANGQIWIINPAGILIGPTAHINVAGLVLTTANLSNADFMSGNYHFNQAPDWNGAVINQGVITITDAGMAVLVAPAVQNSGVIQANLGKVVMASGNEYTLDFYGDELLQFGINATVIRPGVDSNGNPITDAAVNNKGAIIVNGGKVLVTAQVAAHVVHNVINMEGVVRATSAVVKHGEIILMGGTQGVVRVAGKLNASGKRAGRTGGTVKILGDQINIDDKALIDVSGDQGGGLALVGGNAHGAGAEQNASYTLLKNGARVNADALTLGNGGQVVLWSNGGTSFYGTISARGGSLGGNGGSVETSGRYGLNFRGGVDAGAPAGDSGSLLLDPMFLIVATGGSGYSDGANNLFANNPSGTTIIDPASIAVVNANVILQANSDVLITNGWTNVNAGRTLTINAGRSVLINDNIATTNAAIMITANDSSAIAAGRATASGNNPAGDNEAASGNITAAPGKLITSGSGNITLVMGNSTSAPFMPGSIGSSFVPIVTVSTGTLSLTANTGGAYVLNVGNTTLAAPTLSVANVPLTVISTGVLTLPNVAISTGLGSIDLRSLGGALSTANTLTTSGGNINLSSSGVLTIANNLTTTSNGSVSLTGTGITQSSNTTVSSGAGNITVNAGTGTLTMGSVSRLISTGSINITADDVTLNTSLSPSQIGGTGAGLGLASSVSIQPWSAGTTIGLAGGAGTLSLSDAETRNIRAMNVTIGNSSAGLMMINAWAPSSAFASNGLVTLQTGSGGIINSGILVLTANHAGLSEITTGSLSYNAITTANRSVYLSGAGVTQAPTTSVSAGSGAITINANTGALTLNSNSLLLSTDTIILTGDLMSFGGAFSQIGGGSLGVGLASQVIIEPASVGRTIGIAGGSGELQLSASSLSNVRATNVRIGDSGSGAIHSAAWTPSANFAANGVLTLDTADTITQSGALNLATSLSSLLLRDANGVTLNSGNVVSKLAGNVAGSVILTNMANTSLTVSSLTDDLGSVSGLMTTANNSIALANSGETGDINLNAAMISDSGNISLTAGRKVVINSGDIMTGGQVTLIGETGSVSEAGSGLINATLLITTSVGGTILDNENLIGSFNASNSQSGNISLTNMASPLIITGISESGGDIVVNNQGGITVSELISTSMNGAVVLNASGATSDLILNESVSSYTGAISATVGRNIVINGGSLSTIGNETLSSGGIITEVGVGSVLGSLLTLSSSGGITLNNMNTVASLHVTNAASGDVAFTNSQALNITGIIQLDGDFSLHTTGAITQSGALVVNHPGKTMSIAAGASNDVTLTSANNHFSNLAIVNANNVIINAVDGVNLEASVISGDFTLNTGGAITQSGPLSVSVLGKTATFAAGSGNNITVDNASNDFASLSVTSGKDVKVNDINSLNLVAAMVSGSFTLNANGDVTQTGAFMMDSPVSISSNNGNIHFLDKIDGRQALTLNAGSSGNIVFSGDVGSMEPLLSLTIVNAHNVINNATLYLENYTQSAGNLTDFGSGSLNVTRSTSIVANNAIDKIAVNSLILGTNFANLTGTINGGSGIAAINTILFLNTFKAGTHFFNGIDMSVVLPPVLAMPIASPQEALPNTIAYYEISPLLMNTDSVYLLGDLLKQFLKQNKLKNCISLGELIQLCTA